MSSIWLNERRESITSQHGEDGIIKAIFERIGEDSRWCCEFGAWDGVMFSNTFNLINKGWSSVQIESSQEKYIELLKNMEPFGNKVQSIRAFVGVEGATSLDAILKKSRVPSLDLLSIDVDGDDYHIWKGLKNYSPRVVIIEINSSFSTSENVIPGKEGASIRSMVELGKEKGYELAIHTGNCIFVRREYSEALDTDPDGWEELFDDGWVQ